MRVAYVGAFLDLDSTWRLLAAFPPIHGNVYAHHVTLEFRPRRWGRYPRWIGRRVHVGVVAVAHDGKGQAAAVIFADPMVPCEAEVPHVTISTAPGVGPVYSNELLAGEPRWARFAEPVWLTATIDTYPRTQEERRDG